VSHPIPFQLRPQRREHRVDLPLETFQRAFLLLGLLIDNGFLQLKKRVVGELQFQPTETGEFTLLRGHGVELRERTRERWKTTTIKFRLNRYGTEDKQMKREAAHDQGSDYVIM